MCFALQACKEKSQLYCIACFEEHNPTKVYFYGYADAIPSIETLAEEPESQYDDVQSSVTVAAMSSPTKGLVGAGVTSDAEETEEVMEEQNVRGAMRALLHWCQKNTTGLELE